MLVKLGAVVLVKLNGVFCTGAFVICAKGLVKLKVRVLFKIGSLEVAACHAKFRSSFWFS